MQLLLIHSDYIEYETKKRTPVAEEIDPSMKSGRMEEGLTAFVAVESYDEADPIATAENSVDEIRKLLPAGATMPQFALRWILMFPAVSCAIPGGKRPSQVEDNMKTSELPALTEEQMTGIREIYEKYIKAGVHQLW